MRILWVKMGGLWPPTSGGRIRSLEILSAMSRQHEVTVLTTHGLEDDPDGLVQRLPRCLVYSVPFTAPRLGSSAFALALARSWISPLPVDLWKWRSKAVHEQVQTILRHAAPDICVADFLVAVPNIPRAKEIPLVLFEHNVEYMIWRRLAALERRPVHRALLEIEWRKVRRAERAACLRADLTIAVSEADRRELVRLAPRSRITAIPTGVDTTYFKPAGNPVTGNRLVFTGSMDWYPNEDAVLYFGSQILPRIRAYMPDVSVTIVGRNPSAHLRASAERMGLNVTGTVDDVRPYMDEADVYIVPLRAGGGTRLKIFEALAMGKAVVSTTVGAEGLALMPGRDVCLADDPDEFAGAVIGLLDDAPRRRALGEAGRLLVETRYSWDRVAADFHKCCQSVIDEGGRPHAPLVENPTY
jgi:glycosyltransferase involved in cell wall biosynthesis